MNRLFDDTESENHFRLIKEAGLSYKNLVNDTVPATSDMAAEDHTPKVPDHLRAETTDQRFADPVRMHGLEGDRDVSQPFQATRKWHLEFGPDGRVAFGGGEQDTSKMKLTYDSEHGAIMTPVDQPTVRPSWKPLGQKDYPGHN